MSKARRLRKPKISKEDFGSNPYLKEGISEFQPEWPKRENEEVKN
jgi:hypothetical protein